MIELKLKNRKGSFHVNSKEVKDIIAGSSRYRLFTRHI